MTFRRTFAAAIAIAATAGAAGADITVPSVMDVTLEDAALTVDPEGGHRLRFRIINESAADVVLTGVGSPVADAGALVYHSHHGASEPITALILKPDEEADFSTSHLRAHLTGLRPVDGTAPFRLIFRRGEIVAEAHVH